MWHLRPNNIAKAACFGNRVAFKTQVNYFHAKRYKYENTSRFNKRQNEYGNKTKTILQQFKDQINIVANYNKII